MESSDPVNSPTTKRVRYGTLRQSLNAKQTRNRLAVTFFVNRDYRNSVRLWNCGSGSSPSSALEWSSEMMLMILPKWLLRFAGPIVKSQFLPRKSIQQLEMFYSLNEFDKPFASSATASAYCRIPTPEKRLTWNQLLDKLTSRNRTASE